MEEKKDGQRGAVMYLPRKRQQNNLIYVSSLLQCLKIGIHSQWKAKGVGKEFLRRNLAHAATTKRKSEQT